MTYPEIDINVSSEAKTMLNQVKKFGLQVMRPAGIALDKLPNPGDVIAKGSVLWDVMRDFRNLDLHTMKIPKTAAAWRKTMDPMAGILIAEQLGYGDAGLAISMDVSCLPFIYASLFPIPEMQQLARDFCEDREGKMIGCWAITEPNHGTDWSLGGSDPKCGSLGQGSAQGR